MLILENMHAYIKAAVSKTSLAKQLVLLDREVRTTLYNCIKAKSSRHVLMHLRCGDSSNANETNIIGHSTLPKAQVVQTYVQTGLENEPI